MLNAGLEKCVVATKLFTAKIAILCLLALIINNTYSLGSENLEKAII